VIAWRLCSTRFAKTAFSGEGARMAGGRWNDKGIRVVYCGGSLALAALELFVHVDPGDLPDDLVAIQVTIPEDLEVERITVRSLPAGWRRTPGPETLKELGNAWVTRGSSAVLAVPSAIIPAEENYLLNPTHEDFSRVVLARPEPFVFDPRMRRDPPALKSVGPSPRKRR
jgi:RES domain-containing protein